MLLALPCKYAYAQKIEVVSDVVNLGQVQFCTPAKAVFELKNSGNRPLVISKVDTGCGCTVAAYPTTSIGAGTSFTITVSYDARLMGHFYKYVDVYSNASNSPTSLQLSGVVVEEVQDYVGDFPFQIGSLTADCNTIVFEDVHLGEIIQQRFHIFNPTEQIVQPQVMHLPNYLKAEVSPSKVAPNRSAEVTITMDAHFMHDFGYESTKIYLGAHPGEKVSNAKQMNVSAIILPAKNELTAAQKAVAPKIATSETTVKMPIADGKNKSATVTIQNVGKSRLEIQRLQMLTTGLKVELNKTSLDAGETAKLKIKTNPRQLRNLKTMPRILMITNDPDRPKIIIDIDTK
jgi:hypothetical protein